ncbi:MAG: EF-hand domain-containing protein [Bacteroidota bacterium]
MYRLSILLALILLPFVSDGQEMDNDSLQQSVDVIENPVYKPVISISYGLLNFRGDVRNSLIAPAIGNLGVMLNVATFIDKKDHYFVANFNFMAGRLSANQYSYTDLSANLNFETLIYSFGINAEYRFGHLIKQKSLIRPYVTLGIESINFSSKGDLVDADGMKYYYWSDGSIRDLPDPGGLPGPGGSLPLYRDYDYETDLRLWENTEYGLGLYNQRSMAIPVGAGLHFLLSRRTFFSLGVSYHYTLTDYLDNVAYEGTSIQGNRGKDSYIFSHLTLHFDMFSDPSTRIVDLMFADAAFDNLFFDDEDGDFILDVADHCPGTPFEVAVDTLGCPLDGDMDQVPDYLDQESETAPGAWVDDRGVTVSEDAFYAAIESRSEAMAREEAESYLATISGGYRLRSSQLIPEQFRSLDEDGDGYISFDELLKTVDLYFDFQLELDIEGLRDLNDFFFSQ